jgi:hypothetical protein
MTQTHPKQSPPRHDVACGGYDECACPPSTRGHTEAFCPLADVSSGRGGGVCGCLGGGGGGGECVSGGGVGVLGGRGGGGGAGHFFSGWWNQLLQQPQTGGVCVVMTKVALTAKLKTVSDRALDLNL